VSDDLTLSRFLTDEGRLNTIREAGHYWRSGGSFDA